MSRGFRVPKTANCLSSKRRSLPQAASHHCLQGFEIHLVTCGVGYTLWILSAICCKWRAKPGKHRNQDN